MFPAGAMARFLENLVLSVEEVFPRLNDGWLVEEPAELMRRLHGIAGTAATLGCIALSDVARDLEVDHTGEEAQQRFVETARATLRVIRAYSTA